MDLKGTQLIRAPRADVWKRLNEPATLKACLPGCESYEEAGNGTYDAVILAALGPVNARFQVDDRSGSTMRMPGVPRRFSSATLPLPGIAALQGEQCDPALIGELRQWPVLLSRWSLRGESDEP